MKEVIRDCPSDLFNRIASVVSVVSALTDMWSLLVVSGHTHCQGK
jgi:hypothetical protein